MTGFEDRLRRAAVQKSDSDQLAHEKTLAEQEKRQRLLQREIDARQEVTGAARELASMLLAQGHEPDADIIAGGDIRTPRLEKFWMVRVLVASYKPEYTDPSPGRYLNASRPAELYLGGTAMDRSGSLWKLVGTKQFDRPDWYKPGVLSGYCDHPEQVRDLTLKLDGEETRFLSNQPDPSYGPNFENEPLTTDSIMRDLEQLGVRYLYDELQG
jgi:hypothetical protein